jgi:DNA-binding NtrC family response regulator
MDRSRRGAEPILLVEDKDSLRTMLRHALEGQGYAVIEARDESEARAALGQSLPSVVLSDLRLPDGDGFGVLRAAKDADPDLPVIVMTAYGSIQDAVAAMKDGALDFLAKPVDPDHLLLMVERALAQRRLLSEYNLLKEEAAKRRGMPEIIGESAVIRHTLQSVQRAAGSDSTVLLEGESGTGKELFARALHALSDRVAAPFIAINCAAIPESLLEAELFGYEKGAFTGAAQRKPGRFELAQRGTLFLDEVGELPMPLQAKILRAIETRRFERLGGTATVQVDIRLVAATNRGLRQAVANRQFREDLYFRLSVFPVTIPPLRDRPEDIPLLARHFIERTSVEMGRKVMTLSDRAAEMLSSYPWPGNVRELQNALERAVILAEGDTIHPGHLSLAPASVQSTPAADPWDTINLEGSLADATARVAAEAERRKIVRALRDAGGDKGRAADALQVGYKALLAKIRDLGLDPDLRG